MRKPIGRNRLLHRKQRMFRRTHRHLRQRNHRMRARAGLPKLLLILDPASGLKAVLEETTAGGRICSRQCLIRANGQPTARAPLSLRTPCYVEKGWTRERTPNPRPRGSPQDRRIRLEAISTSANPTGTKQNDDCAPRGRQRLLRSRPTVFASTALPCADTADRQSRGPVC